MKNYCQEKNSLENRKPNQLLKTGEARGGESSGRKAAWKGRFGRTGAAGLAASALIASAAFPASGGNSAKKRGRSLQTAVTAKSFDLHFLNEQILKSRFQGLPVGGISGASFNRRSGRFLFLSDDKKNHRFYKLRLQNEGPPYKLHIAEQVFFTKTGRQRPARNMDLEAILFHSPSQDIFAASEGQQIFSVPEPPEILRFSLSGRLKKAWPVPDVFWPRAPAGRPAGGRTKHKPLKIGPYENKGFESLAFDPRNQILWTASEAPLRQDSASLKDDCCIRISGFSMKTQKLTRQHGYKTAAKGAGLTEMLFLEPDVFLTLEREYIVSGDGFKKAGFKKGGRPTGATVASAFSGAKGGSDGAGKAPAGSALAGAAGAQTSKRPQGGGAPRNGGILSVSETKPRKSNGVNKVRLFVTDCSRASNLIQHKKRLPQRFQLCKKSLLFDFDSLAKDGIQADNLEAMAFGPVLRPARPGPVLRQTRPGPVLQGEAAPRQRLLVIVADNNFRPQVQSNQVLFFQFSSSKSRSHRRFDSLLKTPPSAGGPGVLQF